MNRRIRDVAVATVYGGRRVIFFNPYVLRRLPAKVREFFYYHECAHHVLGHTIGMGHPLMREQQADCWAVRTMWRTRRLTPRSLVLVQRVMARLGHGDWTHLPGPQRAINLRRCLRVH